MTRDAGSPRNQFHPATRHSKTPAGDVGWVRLMQCPRVDVRTEKNLLTITMGLRSQNSRAPRSFPGLVVQRWGASVQCARWLLAEWMALTCQNLEIPKPCLFWNSNVPTPTATC